MLIPTRTTCVDLMKSSRSVVLPALRRVPIWTIHPKCVRCSVYRDASASLDSSESLYMANAFRNVSARATELTKEEIHQQLFKPCAFNKRDRLP